MIQQKQQKNTRTEGVRQKHKDKIGFLSKKSNLPPIETRSSSRSKAHHSFDQFSSQKKHKITDIFYEEIHNQKSQENKFNSIIIQKDSILQHSSRFQEDKQQTVLKMHQKRKPNDNLPQICQYHQNKLQKKTQKDQFSQIFQSRHKRHRCCETEPSAPSSTDRLRLNMVLNRDFSCKQKLKAPLLKSSQKLKPIKFNQFQRPQIVSSLPKSFFSPQKNSKFKIFLTPTEAKIISDKLSKPKCSSNCGKINCQCFDESLQKPRSSFNRGPKNFKSEKQVALKKLNLNMNRLKKVENEESIDTQDQQNFNNLRRKINEKKTWRKNMKLKQIKRFDTQVIENEKFIKEKKSENKKKSEDRKLFSRNSPQQSEDQNEGMRSAIRTTSDQTKLTASENNLHGEQKKGNNNNIKKDDKKQTSAENKNRSNYHTNQSHSKQEEYPEEQIEDYEMQFAQEQFKDYKKDHDFQEEIPSGIKNVIKRIQKQPYSPVKNNLSLSSNPTQKTIKPHVSSFGTNTQQHQQPQSIPSFKEKNTENKTLKKRKQQKNFNLQQKIQYWINYDIKRKLFIDNLLNDSNQTVHKKDGPKINLVSAVVQQKIQNHKNTPISPKKQDELTNPLQDSQLTQKINTQHISQLPITVILHKQDSKSTQKENNKQTHIQDNRSIFKQSRVLGKSRHCASSRSNKHSANMFNRSPKSLASTRSKQYFKVPDPEESVDFIKNYKPSNPSIIMQTLIRKQTFKVLQQKGKLFFGETDDNNIKIGLGVQITSNQIFQGLYQNGNRKQGFLKQHDGVYEGPFFKNLRHGYGIFKWNDGQIFKGQWRMGTKNGFGVWTGTDGSYYEGDWHLSMQHGKGKFVHSTSTYQGDFRNFYKQGFGKETFPNGDVFTGQYKNGKPNGKGKYEWKDGTYYDGDFVEGLRDGVGKWHENSNIFYEGEFKRDNKHGKGIEYYKDGTFLQGKFIEGKLLKGRLYNSKREILKQFSQQQQSGET